MILVTLALIMAFLMLLGALLTLKLKHNVGNILLCLSAIMFIIIFCCKTFILPDLFPYDTIAREKIADIKIETQGYRGGTALNYYVKTEKGNEYYFSESDIYGEFNVRGQEIVVMEQNIPSWLCPASATIKYTTK